MLAVGTRLRSNETLKYELKLPRPLLRIDVDAAQQGRCYADDGFVCGDSALALTGLADRLEARGYKADPELLAGRPGPSAPGPSRRSEEHTSELQSHLNLVCRLLLEKKKSMNDRRNLRFLRH